MQYELEWQADNWTDICNDFELLNIYYSKVEGYKIMASCEEG